MRIESPAWVASGWLEATMPRRAKNGERFDLKDSILFSFKNLDQAVAPTDRMAVPVRHDAVKSAGIVAKNERQEIGVAFP
jgi:hypothetical protein